MRNLAGGGVGASRFGRPRRELRSARRLVARPAAHRCRSLASSIPQDSHRAVTSHVPEPTPNFACNSPATLSNLEIRSLELRRFQTLLKLHLIELHASLLGSGLIAARGVVV